MKDLSREEELRKQISRLEDACEKKKWLRVRNTFLVLSGVIYLVAFAWGEMSDIKEYLSWLVGAPIIAGLIMFVSMMVLLYIIGGALEDERVIAMLKGKLNAINHFINSKDE